MKTCPSPNINTSSPVFTNEYTIKITQWTDGSLTFFGGSRVEAKGVTQGVNTILEHTTQAEISNSNAKILAARKESLGITNSIATNVVNSLEIIVENDLVRAVVKYTVDNVVTTDVIDLGTINSDGEFTPFTNGILDGKNIIKTVGKPTTTIGSHAPVITNPILGDNAGRGFVDKTRTVKQKVWVLDYYWVEVARYGGKIVSVTVERVYREEVIEVTLNTTDFERIYDNISER